MKRMILCGALAGLVMVGQPSMAATQVQIDAAWNKGLAWLMTNQHGDGGWSSIVSDGNVTRQALGFQATAAAVEALANINLKTGYTYMGGVAWLSNAEPASVEAAARQMLALKAAGEDVTALATTLASWRNSGSSWGAFPQYEAGLPDNALGILSLMDAQGTSYDINELFSAVCVLMVGQRPTPNFLFPYNLSAPKSTPTAPPAGFTSGGVIPSAYAIMAVSKAATRLASGTCGDGVAYTLTTVVSNGVIGLAAKKNADNGFGDNGTSAILETALALRALKTVAPANAAAVTAFDYLVATQAADGSWAGDALQTAEVMLALAAPTTATGQRPSATVVIDTDNDGIPDPVETILGKNPAVADSRFLANGAGSVVTQPALLRAAAAIVQAPSAASLIDVTGNQSALSPATWNRPVDREVFIAGSSLQMATLGHVLTRLFAPNTTEVLLDDGGIAGAEQGHTYRAYYGMVAGSGVAGLDKQRLLIHVSSQGGSYAGAVSVARATPVARMVINANCTDSNNDHRWSCPKFNTVNTIPDAGLSDVQPALHVGVNVAAGGVPITASDVARLNAAPINALVLGLAVTRPLQNAGLSSLNRANLVSIFAGKIKSSWNEIASNLPAQPMILCKMSNGAQPAANALLLRYACSASAALPAVASSSVVAIGGGLKSPGYLVVDNATVDDVSACLNKVDQGGVFQIGSTQISVSPGSFAIGVLANSRQPDPDDRWTYVAVDGIDASKANVATGKYPAYTEAWMQWRRAAVNGVAAPERETLDVLTLLRQRMSSAEALQAMTGVVPLANKTASSQGITTMSVSTQGDACAPAR